MTTLLSKKINSLSSLIIGLIIGITACNPILYPGPTSNTQTPEAPQLPVADTLFTVEIPPTDQPSTKIFIDLLDETSGLAFNAQRYLMDQKDSTHFTIHLPLTVGKIVKYRYVRDGNPPLIESTPQGKQVRYRSYVVADTGMVLDFISGWPGQTYPRPVGRIQGKLTNNATGASLPDMLITVCGLQTISSAAGLFWLEGVPTGTHNLVVSSMNGVFQPYQQGVVIAHNATTPVEIKVVPPPTVKITFLVNLPAAIPSQAKLRLVGNILQLGNTFADQTAGVPTFAAKAPLMTRLPDDRYAITLDLPAGLFLEYKYSLGDGFWGAEHTRQGSFFLRQIIIPNHNAIVEDTVANWGIAGASPVSIITKAPENTPKNEVVSIQFNLYNSPKGWTHPIPMWDLGNNTWQYILHSPLNRMPRFQYRYCRNDQCGITDAQSTFQDDGYITFQNTPYTLQDEITAWNWLDDSQPPTSSIQTIVQKRQESFYAGVEIPSQNTRDWLPYLRSSFQDLGQAKINTIILSPTWSITSNSPPILEIIPGKDVLSSDLERIGNLAQEYNIQLILFPRINYPSTASSWWQDSRRDFGWWQSWYDQYRLYLLHFAEMANYLKASALILGGGGIDPTLPAGLLKNGTSSGVPEDTQRRWQELVKGIRSKYKGTLFWSLNGPSGLLTPPPVIQYVDKIYLTWSEPLSESENNDVAQLTAAFGKQLDQWVEPFTKQYQKPIVIGLDYPSAKGAAAGCIRVNEQCIASSSLAATGKALPPVILDFKEQADIYSASLAAINEREWIDGVISRGYYPLAVLMDPSTSIRAKPAANVLWDWFLRFHRQTP